MKSFFKLLVVLFLLAITTSAWASALSNNKHVFVNMANSDGPKWAGEDDYTYNYDQGTYDNYYYIKADGGGLNQLHITDDVVNYFSGRDTTTNSQSGSFYITTTSGGGSGSQDPRGYNDTIVLMISVKGTIPDNFSVNIQSDGYYWANPGGSPGTHQTGVVNQTFYKSDFDTKGYSSNVYKPGPGTLGTWSLPLFTGQTDFSTTETILFIDLKVGNIYDTTLTDGGAAKVTYSFSNMNTSASFNAYAWCKTSAQGQGINWTQRTSGTGSSSYTVNY